MDDTTNICLACGICCDGTLIGFVQIDRDETARIKALTNIEVGHKNAVILQPCKSFCNGCTIYSERPRKCASYECSLLQSVENNETGFNTALNTVHEVKQQKTTIENKLESLKIQLQSTSFYFKMIELKKLLQIKSTKSALDQEHLDLLKKVEILDELITQKFGVSFS